MMTERKRLDAAWRICNGRARDSRRRSRTCQRTVRPPLAGKKLQHELEDYRNQRANDIADTESSMEQTRKKYQAEFAGADEGAGRRGGEAVQAGRDLCGCARSWMSCAPVDDEVLNSSTWSERKGSARIDTLRCDGVTR